MCSHQAVNDLLWVAPNLLLCTWSPASASLMKVAEDNGNQLSLIRNLQSLMTSFGTALIYAATCCRIRDHQARFRIKGISHGRT